MGRGRGVTAGVERVSGGTPTQPSPIEGEGYCVRQVHSSSTTAVVSISTLAALSTNPLTSTSAMAG